MSGIVSDRGVTDRGPSATLKDGCAGQQAAGPGLAGIGGCGEADVGGTKIYTNAKGMTLYTYDKDEKGKSTKYTIVGSAEASPGEMRLSNESPVGKALLGRKRGEEVAITTPKGERRLKITKIDVVK